MEHALFIHNLGVKKGAKYVERERERNTKETESKIKAVLGEKTETDLFPHNWREMERNRHSESQRELL